jgi:hypothetical protein
MVFAFLQIKECQVVSELTRNKDLVLGENFPCPRTFILHHDLVVRFRQNIIYNNNRTLLAINKPRTRNPDEAKSLSGLGTRNQKFINNRTLFAINRPRTRNPDEAKSLSGLGTRNQKFIKIESLSQLTDPELETRN